jgi:hypothetical protein
MGGIQDEAADIHQGSRTCHVLIMAKGTKITLSLVSYLVRLCQNVSTVYVINWLHLNISIYIMIWDSLMKNKITNIIILFAFNIHSMSEEFKTYLYQIY